MMKFLSTFLAIAISLNCSGQTPISQEQAGEDNELLYTVPHFSLTLTPYLTHKAIFTTQSGDYMPTSTSVPGGEAGINYHLHLNKAYSLIIGFRAGVGGRNHQLFIAKEEFTPHLERNVDERGRFTYVVDHYFALPVMMEKRWQIKGGNYWNFNAGLNVRYVTDNIFERSSHYADVSGQMVTVEYFQLMVGNRRKPWLNYNIGGGYAWLLNNKNFLRLNILANYSNTEVVEGAFTINVTGKEPTFGIYTSKLSFVSLSINYILSGVKKSKEIKAAKRNKAR